MTKIRPELSEKSLAALRKSTWDEAEARKNIMMKTEDILEKFADVLDVAEDFFDRAGSFLDRMEERRNNDGEYIGQNDNERIRR